MGLSLILQVNKHKCFCSSKSTAFIIAFPQKWDTCKTQIKKRIVKMEAAEAGLSWFAVPSMGQFPKIMDPTPSHNSTSRHLLFLSCPRFVRKDFDRNLKSTSPSQRLLHWTHCTTALTDYVVLPVTSKLTVTCKLWECLFTPHGLWNIGITTVKLKEKVHEGLFLTLKTVIWHKKL